MNVFLMVGQVCVFVCLWFMVFLLHEFCHSLEMYRQTGLWGSIHMSVRGFWTVLHKDVRWVDSYLLIEYSGGMYTCVVLLLFVWVSGGFFQFCFVVLMVCQLVYGLMEGCSLVIYRYYWYGCVWVVSLVLWCWWFVL